MAKAEPHPFIKWAGGKTKIASKILEKLPDQCNTYYEPFVGGGAVFIKMAIANRFKKAVINDKNPELINAWNVIKNDVDSLLLELFNDKYTYNKESYLNIRSIDVNTLDPVQNAARFIYLNKTCFNGLYRVNKSGKFNTPFGKYDNPQICDSTNLVTLNGLLQKVEIRSDDFDFVRKKAKPGDAVYFDPPYIPISKTSSFSSYTNDGFGMGDHVSLCSLFKKLSSKGVSVVLSNSLCKESLDLYDDFVVEEVLGKRSIGGSRDSRNPVKEIIVYAGPSKTQASDC